MNWAFLAKLAWRILASERKAYCEVMKLKNGVKREDGAHFKMEERASQIRKGMTWGAEMLRKELR